VRVAFHLHTDANLEVTRQRAHVATEVEEAKAYQHYDEVLANIHRHDSFEVIAATLKKESALEEESYNAALAEVGDQKELASADTFDEKRAILSAAERHAIEHVIGSILQLLCEAVGKQQAYEDVRDEVASAALAEEDRQVMEAKELELYEIGEITRNQDSTISNLERGFRRDTMTLSQIAELDEKLIAARARAAAELQLAGDRRQASIDAAAAQRQAVFAVLEMARTRIEEEVAEAAVGVGVAVREADLHYSSARSEAGAQCDEGLSVVERSSYDRARLASEKHEQRVRMLREEADASIEEAKRTCKEAIVEAGRAKQRRFGEAAARLLQSLTNATESCRVAEETTRAVSQEADEFIEARAPSVRKEARASYVQNSPLLEFAEADVCKLWQQPELFPDDCFDRILTVNTLYFFPDLVAGLKELRRVLKPTGRMVCVVKCSHVKSGIEAGQLGPRSYTNQLPTTTELLLQALREAGFGASVRASGSVTGDRNAAALSLAERVADGRAAQAADEALRCEPPGIAMWRKELKDRTVPELCRIARGEILRGKCWPTD
jgi:SAM-dependent methyltransferase